MVNVMLGVSIGLGMAALGGISTTIVGYTSNYKRSDESLTILGKASISTIIGGHLVAGYFLPAQLSVFPSLDIEKHGMWLFTNIAVSLSTYVLPNIHHTQLPTSGYMFKGHVGIVQKILEVGIYNPLNWMGIDFDSDSMPDLILQVGIETIDWSTYIMPIGAAIYHLKSLIFGSELSKTTQSNNDEVERSVLLEGCVKTNSRSEDLTSVKLLIEKCINCTIIVTDSEKNSDTFVNQSAMKQLSLVLKQNSAIDSVTPIEVDELGEIANQEELA